MLPSISVNYDFGELLGIQHMTYNQDIGPMKTLADVSVYHRYHVSTE